MSKIVDEVGVHVAAIAPVGDGRCSSSQGVDVPYGHAVGVAEVDDAACHVGRVLIGHLGGGVMGTKTATRSCGVGACSLGDVASRWRGEEEADARAACADAIGEGLHGGGMAPFIKRGTMRLVGAEGDDDKVWAFCCHAVDHVLFVEATCPCAIDAIVGELQPWEVTLKRAAYGAGEVVPLHVGVAYLHDLDSLILLYLPKERGQCGAIKELVGACVAETGGEGSGEGLRCSLGDAPCT